MRKSGNNFISSRRTKRSYGTVLLEPFIQGARTKGRHRTPRVGNNGPEDVRRSRRSYGTMLFEPLVKGEHEQKEATEHPELGTMVQKMFWHIKRVRHAPHPMRMTTNYC